MRDGEVRMMYFKYGDRGGDGTFVAWTHRDGGGSICSYLLTLYKNVYVGIVGLVGGYRG